MVGKTFSKRALLIQRHIRDLRRRELRREEPKPITKYTILQIIIGIIIAAVLIIYT